MITLGAGTGMVMENMGSVSELASYFIYND
jgi:hypothetical protein